MKSKIRVAHLITNFAVGGAQDYLLLIVRGLDMSRFEPIVAGRMEGEWVSLVKGMSGVASFDIPSLRREISPVNDLRAVFEIKRFCQEQGVDILHTHSSKPGIVARIGGSLAGVKSIVHTIHGFSFNDFMPQWRRTLFVGLEKSMSRFTTTLLLYSNGDRKTANELGIGAKHSVETFYYGIEFSPFETQVNRAALRKSLHLREEDLVIGFTGRFSEQKALHVLIRAFSFLEKEFSQLRLLLVGDGPLRKELEDLATQLGVREKIIITGYRSDIQVILKAMDLFVMTSLWEGLSRSLAEAMYSKLPVIATDVGGTSDAVRSGETGWLIRPNSVDAVVVAIREAINKPDVARCYSLAGYEWARQAFDVATMNERITSLYESLYLAQR